MPATAKGVPYPAALDSNDVSAHLQALADFIDANPGVRVLTSAQRDALTGGQLYEGRLIVNVTTGRAERRVGSTWQPAVPLPTPADIGAAPASHGVHGVSSVNGRTGAVTGLAEASHGAHGVSSVNGRTGDVTGLAEAGHAHAAAKHVGGYSAGSSGSESVGGLPFAPTSVFVHSSGGNIWGLLGSGGGLVVSTSGTTHSTGNRVNGNGFLVTGSLAIEGVFYTYLAL